MLKKTPNPSLSSDEWTARLRTAVQKDRRRFRLALWSLALASFAVLGFGVYWIWPPPGLPPLAIVAIDALCLPGEPAQVRAQTEAIGEPVHGLGNLKVAFQGQPDNTSAQTKTSGNGEARANLQFSRQIGGSRFLARLFGDDRRSTIEDSARIFFWPRKTRIVLVDVSDLLADRNADLSKCDLNQLQTDRDLAKLLLAAHARKYEIVYLAIGRERVLDYRQARRWKESQYQNRLLPLGPVLARPSYHDYQLQSTNEADAKYEADARRKLVKELKERYEVKAIARLKDTAEIYEQEQIPCVVFDAAAAACKKLMDSFPEEPRTK